MRAGRTRTWTASALTGLLAAAPILRAAPPSWVTAFPREPGRYVGIGRADKLRNPQRYREAAQAAALAQIGREIAVELRSESRSARSEDADGVRETFDETVTAASSARLAGYEREGTYETEEEFWVYYALDKEVHRRIHLERSGRLLASLAREAEAVEADLRERRFQEAADGYAAAARRYSGEYSGDPFLPGLSAEPAELFDRLTGRMLDATRDLRLEGGEGEWTLDWRASPPPLAPLYLADPRGGRSEGPLRVALADALAPGSEACPAETDGRGRLDLAEAARRCGLGSGEWQVTWKGPREAVLRMRKRISVREREVLVVLRGDTAERAIPWLREELAFLEAPGIALVFAPGADRPRDSLDIRLLDLSRDTLAGMHFSTLRGRVRFPGGAGSAELAGKSGHGDGGRSERMAARDFARQVAAGLRDGRATAAR